MTKVVGPDNLATTTWFYQNDGLKGKPYFSLTAEQSYYTGFAPNSSGQISSTDISNWTFSGGSANTTAHQLNVENYDNALKNYNADADWDVAVNRSLSSAGAGDVVVAQFMIDDGASTQSKLYLATSDQSRVGLYAQPSGTGHSLSLLTKYKTSTEITSDVLFSDSVLKKYLLYRLFFIGESSINVRVWEKGNPDNFAERTITSMDDNLSWGLTQSVYQGTVWLDAVFEGEALQDSRTTYDVITQWDSVSGGATDIANTNLY